MKKKYSFFLILSLVFLFDRLSKEWIIRKIEFGEVIALLPFFNLTYVKNTGIAFGLGQNFNFIFIPTSILLIAVLFFIYYKNFLPQNRSCTIAVSLILGGALGNIYDRIFFKSVIDFLDFFIGSYHWPAFNVADSCICIGVAVLFFSQKSSPAKKYD